MFENLDESQLPGAIEALLFVTDEPVNTITLAQMLEVEITDVHQILLALQKDYEESGRGIQLMEVAGGWRMYTHPAYHELLEKYVLSWDTRKLSAAALEVLAIVAYAQPATRTQISEIRGVTSDGPLNTLIERGYVREVGVAETTGNPTLYGTTRTFLEKYGLNSVADLPPLEDFAPDEKTTMLIRERLGATSASEEGGFTINGEAPTAAELAAGIDERELAETESMAAAAIASITGVVEKIDFDKLHFNTDDE